MRLGKRLTFILSLCLVMATAACGTKDDSSAKSGALADPAGSQVKAATTEPAKKLKIQVSFYPMYEFTKQIAGELADVETLIPATVEPHDWEPTPQDIKHIEESDVLVYNGAGMEGWLDQVLGSVSNTKLVKVEASSGLELMEGLEEEEDHEHKEVHSHDHGEMDPHVWLSPALAIKEVQNIELALAQAAPEHKDEFQKNAEAYILKLKELDKDFEEGLRQVKRKDFITQHAAFGYLAKEYDLVQVPIAGLSPEEEPSAAKMTEIVKFAKEHLVKTIFFETMATSKVADIIAEEIGAKSAVLNPIEGLTEKDKTSGHDYLALMRQNLESLKSALNE